MKLIILFLLIINTFALSVDEKIKNIIGKEKYEENFKLINVIFTNKNIDYLNMVKKLKDNSLFRIDHSSVRLIDTTFILKGNNPFFEERILFNIMRNMGYYYFYPESVENKDGILKISMEIKADSIIDPEKVIKNFTQRQCEIENIQNIDDVMEYNIDCTNAILIEAKTFQHKLRLVNAKGEYWINVNNFDYVKINTSRLDKWYPYVVLFDKKLNIIDIIKINKITRFLKVKIPQEAYYMKITDLYMSDNIKRGILLRR